jgi:CheY-like chemotaxis protein
MNILCSVRGHEPSPNEVCNGGHCFTRCKRCGAELIKEGSGWRPVPKGFRIVWKEAEEPSGEDRAGPPAVAAAESAPPVEPPAAPAALLAEEPLADPAHVLVCDDDSLVADLLEHRLAGRGYRVTIARDGAEALELLGKTLPDAVLLDAMMPMVDGYEVLRRMRSDPAMAKIPVIMLTARKQERDIVGALGLGANDFVVKPFIPEELLSRLARLIAAARGG